MNIFHIEERDMIQYAPNPQYRGKTGASLMDITKREIRLSPEEFAQLRKCQVITIYGELYSTKNHTQILRNPKTGKPFVAKSAKSKSVEQGLLIQLQASREAFRAKTDTSVAVQVQFKIYRRTHGRFDYVNIVQGLADLMIKAGWLPDDSADYFIPSFLPYEVDAKNPRVEITVL